EKALRGTRSDSSTDRRPTVLRRDGAGGIRLSRTNREISGGTADSGTETEEARSMASRPSRDSPGQYLRIGIVGMSYILIVREIHHRKERRGKIRIGDQLVDGDARLGSSASTGGKQQHTRTSLTSSGPATGYASLCR